MKKSQRYWQQHNTRRPLPAMYEAYRQYGNKVYQNKPKYVMDGYCQWCGKQITNSRRKSFCSNECSKKFNDATVWHRGRGTYAMHILYRDNFTCQDCGQFKALLNEHDIYVPIDAGLEIHHVIPVSEGGGDEPENLITLCHECHMARHHKKEEEDEQ